MTMNRPMSKFFALFLVGFLAVGCSSLGLKRDANSDAPLDKDEKRDAQFGRVTGEGIVFGGPSKAGPDTGSGIAVNSFLWRASLDSISFMPLASADPFGGVIITDWYATPEVPNERFKLTVYVLDKQLRSDGIRVAVFKQVRDASGAWVEAAVDPHTAPNLENEILTRARQLRIAQSALK